MPFRHPLRLLAALTLAAAALSAATPVLGHAELDTIDPANNATVSGSPTEIVATFTEDLNASASSLRIVDAANHVVVEGGDVSGGKTLTLAITTPLVPGPYTVRWTSKSADDGDVDHGQTTFTVAAPASVAPSASPSAIATEGASATASVVPSATATASVAPATPASSTSDALIPIVAVLILLALAGAWLLRGRSRVAR